MIFAMKLTIDLQTHSSLKGLSTFTSLSYQERNTPASGFNSALLENILLFWKAIDPWPTS